MKRYLLAALCAATLAIVAAPVIDVGVMHGAAFAQATAAAPETIAQATGETTKVTWAYGAVVSQWATAIGTLLFGLVMYALRLLPAQVYAIIVSMRADQLLQKAIDYGINAVAGAAKDKTLTLDVGNDVLAHAVQYALDSAPGWLQSWLGGPDAIVKKIFARLNIDPAATAPDTSTVLAQAAATTA